MDDLYPYLTMEKGISTAAPSRVVTSFSCRFRRWQVGSGAQRCRTC